MRVIGAASSLVTLLRGCYADQQQVLLGIPSDEVSEHISDIPAIGFGTWNLDRSNASKAVVAAFKAGYRHIDCAAIYGNEKEVGEGIRLGMALEGVKREEIWVTSKLWNTAHEPEAVPKALNKTLTDLGLDYLDLYLMHWPVASSNGKNEIKYLDTWKAMTALIKPSTTLPFPNVRKIGVSNFSPSQLEEILPIHTPYSHQFESHPYLPQQQFVDSHTARGIHVTAYSPLGNSNPTYTTHGAAVISLLENPTMLKIAKERGCTPAQVALKWGMQRGVAVIPKSAHKDRIEENWESLGCNLATEDFETLAKEMPRKRFNNPSQGWGVALYDGLEDSDIQATPCETSRRAYWVGWMSGVNEWVESRWNDLTVL